MAGTHSWLLATTAATSASVLLSLPFAATEIAIQGPPQWTAQTVAAVVYLGVLAQAAAYALWNLALNFLDASVAGRYVNLAPVVGVILALAVGETMTALQILGGLTVASGVWLNREIVREDTTNGSHRTHSQGYGFKETTRGVACNHH